MQIANRSITKHIFTPTIFAPQTQNGNPSIPTRNRITTELSKTRVEPKKVTQIQGNPEHDNVNHNQHPKKIAHKTKAWRLSQKNLTRGKLKRSRIRLRNEQRPRRKTIANKPGKKTISAISLNPDNVINNEKQNGVLRELQRHKIHIAEIQETHIPHDVDPMGNRYKIPAKAAQKTEAGQNTQHCMYQGG